MTIKVNTSIRLDKDIKEKLQLKAESIGTTLSNVFNMYAYKFVNTGEIEYYKGTNNLKIEIEEIEGSIEFIKTDEYKKGKKLLESI